MTDQKDEERSEAECALWRALDSWERDYYEYATEDRD